MTVHAWRIVKAKLASTAFSGDGARRYGGRWNISGRPVVYVAQNASLAILETLVHLRTRELVQQYVLFHVQFDGRIMTALDPKDLPESWRRIEPSPEVQRLGDAWLAGATSAVLRVPSVIVPTEWNYLLNPAHPHFPRIKIGPRIPVRLDLRLIKT
jgi:RES domain-containing protein